MRVYVIETGYGFKYVIVIFFVSLENKKKIYFNIESSIAVWQGEKPVIVSRWKNSYERFPQIFWLLNELRYRYYQ